MEALLEIGASVHVVGSLRAHDQLRAAFDISVRGDQLSTIAIVNRAIDDPDQCVVLVMRLRTRLHQPSETVVGILRLETVNIRAG